MDDYNNTDIIKNMALKFGEKLSGYWSVDFAKTIDNKWYMIDAARGELSWHPEDCKFYKKYLP